MIKIKLIFNVLLLVAALVLNGCNRAVEEASLSADVVTEAPLVGSFYVVGYK